MNNPKSLKVKNVAFLLKKLIKISFKILFLFLFPVIRNLLTNIVEIENQRLEIEKQRFEYEKTVGNELLSMFRTFIAGQAIAEKHQNSDTNEKPRD